MITLMTGEIAMARKKLPAALAKNMKNPPPSVKKLRAKMKATKKK